jgi:hypothetical protein
MDRLLRWYPRAWRERYGEEFLAMVEDTLGGRQPGWRLHLGVAWAGLRERARRVVPATLRRLTADAKPPEPAGRLDMVVIAMSAFLFWSTHDLLWVPASADGHRYATAAVTTDVMTGLWIVSGVAITAAGLAAGPALVRLRRAGGWKGTGWPAARAAGATVLAAAALTRVHLLERSRTLDQVPGSGVWISWSIAAMVLLGSALVLWRQVVMAIAGRLELSPRVRAVQIVLYTASATAIATTGSIQWIWIGQVRSSDWLLANGAFWILYRIRSEPARLYWAWHRARQLRAGTAGGR